VNDALRPFVDQTHMHRSVGPLHALGEEQQGAIATAFVLKTGVYAATLHAAALDDEQESRAREAALSFRLA
jgi:hypothetical protein